MERERLAVVVVALGTGLFGAAIAARGILDPWWSNAGVAVVVIAASAAILGRDLGRLLEVRVSAIVGALLLAAAMVAATHLGFSVATEIIRGLAGTVDALYQQINDGSMTRAISVLLIAVVVIAEEALWRGVVIELCAPRLGRAKSGLVAVVLYTLPQIIGGSWVLMAAAVVAGAVFTAQRLLGGNLVAPIVTHLIWSACIFSLLPLGQQPA